MPTRTIILVGFMGAGKTSVGQVIARQLGWSFEDLDDRIERREGRSIPDIFQELGEAEFRRAESKALAEALSEGKSPAVLALGGGAYAQPENAALLSGLPVVFLDGTAEELWDRCQRDQRHRPMRQNPEQFRALYESRRPYYLRAFLRIETSGKDIDTIAAEVCSALALR